MDDPVREAVIHHPGEIRESDTLAMKVNASG
jgi:hypothetical protein